MRYDEEILNLLEKNNGTITSSQVTELKIPRYYLADMVSEGIIYKTERGIYVKPDLWEDEMYILQLQYSRGIFSNETALYLHSMTDRTPISFTMTFPRGYNSKSIKDKNIQVRYAIRDIYNLGATSILSPCGNELKVYNVERTLCDIVKGNNSSDIQVVNQAMKEYAASKEKDMNKLLDYAETLRVKQKVLKYMEVLL